MFFVLLGSLVYQLVLLLGDLHIPHRVSDIPPQFKALLMPNKIQHIVCTGNAATKEVMDYLKTLTTDIHMVKGEFDELPGLPDTKTLTVGAFKIGVCHGHQVIPWSDTESLRMLQRKMDVDILVTGHSHEFSYKEVEEGAKLLINPGSITGAYSPLRPNPTPSFVLMDVSGGTLTTFVYRLQDGEVDVTRLDFTKKNASTPNSPQESS